MRIGSTPFARVTSCCTTLSVICPGDRVSPPGSYRSARTSPSSKPCIGRELIQPYHVQSLVDAAREEKRSPWSSSCEHGFDEEANIELAHDLEEAGAHVVYGVMVGLKTHAKMSPRPSA